jgi:septin family protein
MLVQPQQTKDDDNDPKTHMNNPPTSVEFSPSQSTPITFNVLVVGQAGIGKTGLIKLLLDTSNLSSATSLPQLARLAEFANFAATCPTNSPSSILAELPATPHRPEIVLKLIDTPGLLYHDPHELEAGLHLVLRQIAESFEASTHTSASVRRYVPFRPMAWILKRLARHRNAGTNKFNCAHSDT